MTDSTLTVSIQELKTRRNAVILAHNYQSAEVQEIADFSGDSLELARVAQNSDAQTIVFCGVHFMAETAVLLSPQKTVLLPDEKSGCPMADMISGFDLKALKSVHPEAVVVCYVNSTAEVKSLSDVCCTSSNAANIIERIPPNRKIIFVPDQYLATHVERITGRRLIKWPGYCPTHAKILADDVTSAQTKFPGAPVIVHPECRADICLKADEVLSTGQMVSFSKNSDSKIILVGTELGLLHRLSKENPEKQFVPLSKHAVCPNMKRNNLENIMWALQDLSPKIEVSPLIAGRARAAVLAMFEDGPITPLGDGR